MGPVSEGSPDSPRKEGTLAPAGWLRGRAGVALGWGGVREKD